MSKRTALLPSLAGSRVLITGATGFIGGTLAERLITTGARVTVLARVPDRAAGFGRRGVAIITADLSRPETLTGCCRDIDVVFHCGAWLGKPYTKADAWGINVNGTEHLARQALSAGVRRFVHLSSIAVYGPVRSGIVTEDAPVWRGVELYGDSKIAGEEAVRRAMAGGLPGVIVRPGMVYGPRSRGWTVRMVQWIQAGRPAMVAGGRGFARPIFIENLVDALLLCASRPVTGETFTLIDSNLPWRDFLGLYGRMLQRPVRSVSSLTAWLIALTDELRAALTRRPPRVRRAALGYAVSHATMSTEKAQRMLGWSPRYLLDEAMRITERWLKENGYLS